MKTKTARRRPRLEFPHYPPTNGITAQRGESLASTARASVQSVWETTAKAYGHWELFQAAKKIDGYANAIGSAHEAAESIFRSEGLIFDTDLRVMLDDSDADQAALFFFKLAGDPSATLKEFVPLVSAAAARGDVKFFQHICETIRNTKRQKGKDPLKFHLLIHWIASSLWLASDHAGASYLQVILKRTVGEATYAKEKRRLRLQGYCPTYPKPMITGCKRNGQFVFNTAWRAKLATDLPGCHLDGSD